MAMTYQEFLRQNEQYNKQRGITTGQPVTNAYGPPEYLATYLEGQSAAEARSRQLAMQEHAETRADQALAMQGKAYRDQAAAEKAQFYTTAGLGAGYLAFGTPGGMALTKAATSAITPAITPATTIAPAISAYGTEAAIAPAGIGAALPEGVLGSTTAVPAAGPMALAAPAAAIAGLTYGSYKIGQKMEEQWGPTASVIKSVIAPFFDPIGTVKTIFGGGK